MREKAQNPKMTQDDLARFASAKFGLSLGRSTVSDILKESDKWIATAAGSQTKKRAPKHEQLEEALFLWFGQARNAHLPLSEKILIEQAQNFGIALGIENFSYSRGWLQGFKARHGISSYRAHGEAGGVDEAAVEKGRVDLKKVLEPYSPDDIYNMDETGLFFRLEPDKTLASGPVKGRKKSKERITVALCCNASGTDKMMPLVIGKSKNPRGFPKNFNVQQIVHYFHNQKAWMTSTLFSEWIKRFDTYVKRKVILLLDNASSHVHHLKLKNVVLQKLPPNTTSHIQQLDAGIIRNFKIKYQQYLVKHYVAEFNEKGAYTPINLKQAIYFVKDSWNDVASTTISNCFYHTKILPMPTPQEQPIDQRRDLNELDQLIQCLAPCLQSSLSSEEFVELSAATEENMSYEEILTLITASTAPDEDLGEIEEDDGESLAPLSTKVAIEAGEYLLRYMEQSESFGESDYFGARKILQKVKDAAVKERIAAQQQTSITDFFN